MLLTSLFKGSDMATKVGLLLVHGSNFGQIPFHHQWLIYGYQRELNPGSLGANCHLNSEPQLLLFSVIESTDYIENNLGFHYAAVWGIGDLVFFQQDGTRTNLSVVWAPTQDGGFDSNKTEIYIPEMPSDMRQQGNFEHVPAIVGINAQDGAEVASK